MKLIFEDEKIVYEPLETDTFFMGFNGNLFLRESCYQCHYCGENRISDFTVADFWGVNPKTVPQKNLKLGVSLISPNTQKAKMILKELHDELYFEQIEANLALPYNPALIKPYEAHPKKDYFFSNMDRKNFDKLIKSIFKKRYIKLWIKRVIIQLFGAKTFDCIKKIMGKSGN